MPIEAADDYGAHGLAQDEIQHVAVVGAEGEADADFVEALADAVRDDAVDADGGEKKREGAEDAGKRGDDADGVRQSSRFSSIFVTSTIRSGSGARAASRIALMVAASPSAFAVRIRICAVSCSLGPAGM